MSFSLNELVAEEFQKTEGKGRVTSPLGWFGGKYNLAKWIIALMPKHQCYVEPFFGAGHILFNKQKVKVEVINDIDDRVYALFKVLSDENTFKEFVNKIWFLGCHEKVYNEMVEKLEDKSLSMVDKAVAFLYVNKLSLSGNVDTYFMGHSKALANVKNNLLSVYKRLKGVDIYCGDWKRVVEKYDKEDALVLLDPPYVEETRSNSMGKYINELSDKDHEEIVDVCLRLKSKVILCGYQNKIYERLEQNGWHRLDKKVKMSCAVVKEGTKHVDRVESVWLNYKPKGARETLV
jgi:DNA adenine methylase